MFLPAELPTREQREREYAPFSIDGERFDVWSFPDRTPFSAASLGHHWDQKDTGGCPVVGRLKPGFYLVNTGERNSNPIRGWGVSLPEIYYRDYHEFDFYERQFDRGDLCNESKLGARLEKGGSSNWVANLFVGKACQLLKPVLSSAERGNPSAIGAISYLAHLLTDALERITKGNGEEVRKISNSRFCWPVLHSPHSQLKTEQRDSYIANLSVGSKLPVRVEHARWSDDPLSMLALDLITFVHRLRADRDIELGKVCRNLPELTKETAKSHWWPIAREIFSFSYPDPLGVEEFREMVKYEQDDSSLFKSAFLNALRDKLVSLARR